MRATIKTLRWLGWTYIAAVSAMVAYGELRVIMGHGVEIWELTRPMTPYSLLFAAAGLVATLVPGALLIALAGRADLRRRRGSPALLRSSV